MMMREQQWDRSNCRHFRIDVCLHQRIYMRAFVNARNYSLTTKNWRCYGYIICQHIAFYRSPFIIGVFQTIHRLFTVMY